VITSDVLGALRRRWYLLVLGILGSLGLILVTLSWVPVTYQAKAMIVLLPPRSLDNTGGNPYLALGGLDSVAGVLSRSMATESVTDEVHEVAPGAEFTVAPDATTSGPVLLVTAEADSPGAALAAANKIVDVAPRQMMAIQRSSGVRSDSFITTSVVTQDARALPQHKAQIRALLAIGLGSLAATVLGVAWIDGIMLRRRERTRLRVVDGPDEDQAPDTSRPSSTDDRRRGGGRNGRGDPPSSSDVTDRQRDARPRARTGRGGKRDRGVARTLNRDTLPTGLGVTKGTPG
jgi:capsular polysaccharide biosynthesis protein